MIDSFDLLFSKILIRNSENNKKKEVFIGILLSLLFIIFFFMNKKYTKLGVMSFFIFTSFASFLNENQVFMVYEDFKILDIDINSFRFFKMYIIQRIFMDNYILNAILFLIVSIFLIIKDVQTLLWLIIVIVDYIILMPVIHRIGKKHPSMILAKVILDVGIIAAFIIGCVNNFKYVDIVLNEPGSIKNLLIFLCIVLVISMILFKISMSNKKKTTSNKSIEIYKSISWIKSIDIEIYKDYLLNFKGIVISIISTIVLFFIIKDVSDKYSTLMTVIFVIAPVGIFSKRTKGEYDLIKYDYMFFDNNLSCKDIKHMKLSKLKTILTEVIIKVVLTLILLMICGEFNKIHIIVDVFIIATISAMIHFIIIIKNNRFTTIYINIVKYTLIVVGLLKIYGSINEIVFLSYMSFVFILTLLLILDVLREGKMKNE